MVRAALHISRLEKLWMDDRWLSVEEIAEHLGVSKDTVYTWVSSKRMPGHRVGRFWKFKKEEVDEWVRAGGAAAESTTDVDSDHADAAGDTATRKKSTP